MVWVTYVFEAAVLSFIDEDDQDSPEEGDWSAPFPNEVGNNTAYGLAEAFARGPDRPRKPGQWGDLTRIIVSRKSPFRP